MLPVLFKIGSFELHTYGVVLMIAFLIGVFWAHKRGARVGMPKGEIGDLSIWLLVSGVVGARLLYILQEYHTMSWSEVLSFQFAGLTSFGALVLGLASLFWFAKRKKRPAVQYLDVFIAPMVLGQAIGRVGCVLNGCCLGGPCDPKHVPWAVTAVGESGYFHPAQIYESLILLGLLGVILFIEKRGIRPGQMFGLGMIVMGVARFIYEFWRAGTVAEVKAHIASSTYWGSLPITQAQAVAGLMVIIGVVAFVVFGRRAAQSIEAQPV